MYVIFPGTIVLLGAVLRSRPPAFRPGFRAHGERSSVPPEPLLPSFSPLRPHLQLNGLGLVGLIRPPSAPVPAPDLPDLPSHGGYPSWTHSFRIFGSRCAWPGTVRPSPSRLSPRSPSASAR